MDVGRTTQLVRSCLLVSWLVACGSEAADGAQGGAGGAGGASMAEGSSGAGGGVGGASGGASGAVGNAGTSGGGQDGAAGGGTAGNGGDGGGGGGLSDGGAAADAGVLDAATCDSGAADVIWVLDNSASMLVEAAAVQENMNAFATALAARRVEVSLVLISSTRVVGGNGTCDPNDLVCQLENLGTGPVGVCIDAPFGSGMCPDDSRPPHFLHLDVEVGSTDALQIILDQYPSYAHMMRPGVPKHFTVVSDDDSAMDAETFSSEVAALDATLFDAWTFHGIYSMSQCPNAAAIGTVYDQLVEQTMGARGDLCSQDFPPVFDAIVDSVSGGAASTCP
jgi:hypothetical protein